MDSLTKNCLLQHVLCLEQQITSLRTMIMIAAQVKGNETPEHLPKKQEANSDFLGEEAEDRLDVYWKSLTPAEVDDVLG